MVSEVPCFSQQEEKTTYQTKSKHERPRFFHVIVFHLPFYPVLKLNK